MQTLPDSFIQTVTGYFGEAGRVWLANLPARIEECRQAWSLTLAEPFPLSINYVAPGVRTDGSPVVVKIGVPNIEVTREITSLKLYEGQGMVRLLDALPDRGAMLQERILPGTPLAALQDDDEATRILANQMQQIWRPMSREDEAGAATPANGSTVFVSLERWTEGIRRYGGRHSGRHSGASNGLIPRNLFDRAEGMLDEFLASQGEPYLLHGDLHHDNVLRSERDGWLGIDPKGVVGEREFDAGPMMWNPWWRIHTWPDLWSVLGRRLDILREILGFDRQRLLGWCFIEAVLSMVWDIESSLPKWDHCLPIAETLGELIG
jgi:streptomycin 6-kinase